MALRDIILFAIILGGIPFILRQPYIGVLYWVWIGIMNPHRLTWGAAYDFQFAQIIAVATLVGILITKDERRWKHSPEIYALIALIVWMNVTTLFAFEPQAAVQEWKRVMKIQLMTFAALVVLNSKRHIELLVWVLALSVGLYGFKGGIFTVMTGGEFRVWGPAGSYIEDNNALALATVMTIPLLYYLFTQTAKRWLKVGLGIAMALCAISVLGSYSRGALLAIGAMGVLLWFHSRNKLLLGGAFAAFAPLILVLMPVQWTRRMDTIVEYEGESSAESRLATWGMLFRVANDRPLGAGFDPYTRRLFEIYMPDWPTVHAAHSIWFEMLGEHGWIGLVLFVLTWALAWRTSNWILKTTRDRDELKWAHSLSAMIQVTLIGYFVGGTFLNLAYWDLPYYELILLVIMRDLVRRQMSDPEHRLGAGPSKGSEDVTAPAARAPLRVTVRAWCETTRKLVPRGSGTGAGDCASRL